MANSQKENFNRKEYSVRIGLDFFGPFCVKTKRAYRIFGFKRTPTKATNHNQLEIGRAETMY
jgi:hypothetical protein